MATSTTTLLPNTVAPVNPLIRGVSFNAGGSLTVPGQNTTPSRFDTNSPLTGSNNTQGGGYNGGYGGNTTATQPWWNINNNSTTTPQSGVGTKIISGGGAKITPTYSGFNSLNGQPISATNPQATAAQLQANVAAGKGYGSTQNTNTNTSSTKTNSNGTASTFQGLVNDQANTLPYAQTTTAVGNSNNIGTGTGLTATQQQQQNNINQGAQISANIAQNQTPTVRTAYNNLQNFNQNSPLLEAGFMNNPNLTAAVAAGRGQILGNQLANEQQGLANTYNSAVQGEAQQLTGAQQQTAAGVAGQGNELTGANQAGNLANTAQGNQITAQNNATQNLLDSLTQQGYVILNKTTGQPLDSAGAAAAATQGAGIQSAYNNALAGGTAVTSANATGLQGALQDYNTLNAQVQSAENLGGNVLSALKAGGINTSNSTDFNSAVNNLSQRLGSSNYTNFLTALNDARNAYQTIFTANGQATPTDAGASMAVLGNPSSTVGQIVGALNTLNENAYSGRLQPAYQKMQTYQSGLNGSSGSNGSSSTTSNSGWSSLGD